MKKMYRLQHFTMKVTRDINLQMIPTVLQKVESIQTKYYAVHARHCKCTVYSISAWGIYHDVQSSPSQENASERADKRSAQKIAHTNPRLRICKMNKASMRRFDSFFPQTTLIRWTNLEMMQRTGTKLNTKVQNWRSKLKSKIGTTCHLLRCSFSAAGGKGGKGGSNRWRFKD